MTDHLASIARQRGKVVALFIVCGTAVAFKHEAAAAAIFAAIAAPAAPVAALAAMEAWAAKKGD